MWPHAHAVSKSLFKRTNNTMINFYKIHTASLMSFTGSLLLYFYWLNIGPCCLSGRPTRDYYASQSRSWNAGVTALSQLLPLDCGTLCPSVLDLHLHYLFLNPCWKPTFLIWRFINEYFFLLYCFLLVIVLYCLI